jgi:hypothetical protein
MVILDNLSKEAWNKYPSIFIWNGVFDLTELRPKSNGAKPEATRPILL